MTARSLRTGRSTSIGIAVPDIEYPLYASLVRGVEDVAKEYGYQVLLTSTADDPAVEAKQLRGLLSSQVRQFVVIPSPGGEDNLRWLRSEGAEVVVVNRVCGFGDFDSVCEDDFQGGREATTHLIDLGHRRIGHIGGPSRLSTESERQRGYRQALADAEIPYDPSLVWQGPNDQSSGMASLGSLLADPQPPTAVFVSSGPATLGALKGCQQSGITIGHDLSIIGYGDAEWTHVVSPPLTVVGQPLRETGIEVGQLLFNGPLDGTRHMVLPPHLIIRASTSPPQINRHTKNQPEETR